MDFKRIEDVLEVAVRIERSGVEFYRVAGSMAHDPLIKDAMNILAAEEEKHIGIFRSLLDNIADYNPRFEYPGEYETFISGVAQRVINGSQRAEEFLKAKDLNSALNAAISLEMDAIMFYNEISLEFADKKARDIIYQIINEEKDHWARLAALKKKSDELKL
jgi:rubrerythrin